MMRRRLINWWRHYDRNCIVGRDTDVDLLTNFTVANAAANEVEVARILDGVGIISSEGN